MRNPTKEKLGLYIEVKGTYGYIYFMLIAW